MGQREPIPLIRQAELRPTLDLLSEIGAPTGRLLARARLPARVQQRGDGFAAARSLFRFMAVAADYAEMEDLGWRSAMRARVEELGAWGEPVSRCWRLRDAIQAFCTLYARDVPFAELGLALETEHAWLWRRRDLPQRDPRGEMLGEQFMLGAMVQMVRMAAGCHWTPPAIRIESPCSDWALRAAGLGKSQPCFGGPVLAIAVPHHLLDRRLTRATSLDTERAGEAANDRAACNFAGSLQQALTLFTGEMPISLELGAEIANTSSRTLRRWLAQEGTSWRQVVDRVRFRACEELLLDPAIRLTEISAGLGYADQAHFTRAFLRWTGETPGAWRRRRLDPDA